MKAVQAFSIVELVMVLTALSVIVLLFYPSIYTSTNSFSQGFEMSGNAQKSRAFFLYVDKIVDKSDSVLVAASNNVTLAAGSDTYQISIDGFPGPTPYQIVYSKNGGPTRILLDNIAELTGPSRPGLEFSYQNSSALPETSTPSRKIITMTLSVKGAKKIHTFSSSSNLVDDDVTM